MGRWFKARCITLLTASKTQPIANSFVDRISVFCAIGAQNRNETGSTQTVSIEPRQKVLALHPFIELARALKAKFEG